MVKEKTKQSAMIAFVAGLIILNSCKLSLSEDDEIKPMQKEFDHDFQISNQMGGSVDVPLNQNLVSFVNNNPAYSTFYLNTGLYTSSGVITRSNVTITKKYSFSIPRIKGWLDVRGDFVKLSNLTWDGDDWLGNQDAGSPPGALVFVSGKSATIEYNTFRDIDNLGYMVLIWAGTGSNGQAYDVQSMKLQYNSITNWKLHEGFIYAIMLGNFSIDIPPAVGAHIRWNTIVNGPTTGTYGGIFYGNPAITIADGPLPYSAGYNPNAYQPINVEGNFIDACFDAFSIKANNINVRYNVIGNSYSDSSPGLQNRFGSWNVFEGNLVSGASNGAGILIWSGNGLTFRNNIIRDNSIGILFRARNSMGIAGQSILINNNTLVRNSTPVLFDPGTGYEYSPHTDVVFINDIFFKKDGSSSIPFQIHTPSQSGFTIWTSISYMGHNLFANGFNLPTGGPCYSCINLSSGNNIFDNVSMNDFDLEIVSSPAINAGTNWSNGMPLEDFERKTRPVGNYDIGALEKNGN